MSAKKINIDTLKDDSDILHQFATDLIGMKSMLDFSVNEYNRNIGINNFIRNLRQKLQDLEDNVANIEKRMSSFNSEMQEAANTKELDNLEKFELDFTPIKNQSFRDSVFNGVKATNSYFGEDTKTAKANEADAMLKNNAALASLVAAISSGSKVKETYADNPELWKEYARYYTKQKEIVTGKPIPKTESEIEELAKWLANPDTNGGQMQASTSKSMATRDEIDQFVKANKLEEMVNDIGSQITNNSHTNISYTEAQWEAYAKYYIRDKAERTGSIADLSDAKIEAVKTWLMRDYGK